jgi:hypothetical protein
LLKREVPIGLQLLDSAMGGPEVGAGDEGVDGDLLLEVCREADVGVVFLEERG